MKSLDEVIEELERQQDFIQTLMQDGTQYNSDVLYYLKEYQKSKQNLVEDCDRHMELYLQYREMIDELESKSIWKKLLWLLGFGL